MPARSRQKNQFNNMLFKKTAHMLLWFKKKKGGTLILIRTTVVYLFKGVPYLYR